MLYEVITHVVFKTGRNHLIVLVSFIAKAAPRVLAHAVQGKHLDAGDVFCTPCQYHSAFARYHILGHVETSYNFV